MRKDIPHKNKKASRNQALKQEAHQMDEDLDCPLVRYLGHS